MDSVSKLIVHIATDEKFINTAYEIYEKAFPDKNLFIILKKERDPVKHLSSLKKYIFIDSKDDFLKGVQELSSSARLIVFHGMNIYQANIATKLKKENKKYLWSVFGGEVYDNYGIIGDKSIGESTYKKFIFSYKEMIMLLIRPWYYKFSGVNANIIKQSFSKMDFIGILYEEETEYGM